MYGCVAKWNIEHVNLLSFNYEMGFSALSLSVSLSPVISHQNFLLFLFNSLEKEKFPFYLNKSENVTMQKKGQQNES